MKKAKRYKINGEKIIRNILFLLIVFVIFNMLTSTIFGKKTLMTTSITVKTGDTLWSISKKICNKDSSLNIQEVIYDIKEINGLDSNEIVAVKSLYIPVYN